MKSWFLSEIKFQGRLQGLKKNIHKFDCLKGILRVKAFSILNVSKVLLAFFITKIQIKNFLLNLFSQSFDKNVEPNADCARPLHWHPDASVTWYLIMTSRTFFILLYPQVIGPVITYFESTWLYRDYPLQLWNVYTCSLHGEPRTNNYAEGGNNAINQSMGVSNPTIYKFTENLQLYNCEAETQLLQVDTRLKNPRRVIGKRLYNL